MASESTNDDGFLISFPCYTFVFAKRPEIPAYLGDVQKPVTFAVVFTDRDSLETYLERSGLHASYAGIQFDEPSELLDFLDAVAARIEKVLVDPIYPHPRTLRVLNLSRLKESLKRE